MDNKPKRELRRSNAYPSITLKDAVDLIEFLYKNSGHSFIKLEDVAKLTNKSVGSMSQKVGSAVQYGLLELKSGIGYRPSDLFKKIFKPVNEKEKENSLLEAFKSPKLYIELIERFKSSALPSEIILPNILERDYNVFDDAAKKAAQVFLENIEFLGLKNSHNELDVNSNFDNNENTHIKESNSIVDKSDNLKQTQEIEEISSNQLLKIEIGLTDNKKAIIFYPHNISAMDIELMKLQLGVLEKFVEFKIKPEA